MILIPKDTPWGPEEARLAWADAVGSVVIVQGRGDGGRRAKVNVPADGVTLWVDSLDLLGYEEPGAGMPQAWDADPAMERLALAAAQAGLAEVREVADLADPEVWKAVARAVVRVHLERGIAESVRARRTVFDGRAAE